VDVWEDCGTPEAVLHTNRYLLRKVEHVEPATDSSIIVPPAYVDPTARLENRWSDLRPRRAGCHIESSIVGPYVSLAEKAQVHRSIITDSVINKGAQIQDAMLTRSLIGEAARVRGNFESLNVGDSSQVDSAPNIQLPNESAG